MGYAHGTNTPGDFDEALAQHEQQLRAAGIVLAFNYGSTKDVRLTESFVHIVPAEAAIHKTRAHCRELRQVSRRSAIGKHLHVELKAIMQVHAQELKQRCDHLKAIRAQVESAELMDSDLKAELKQTELELQLKQA